MRLLIPPGVFKPPSDSRLLAAAVAREDLRGATALDLCSGSGVIAVAAAAAGARVTAIDVSRRAVATAKLNGWLNGGGVRARRGDLYAPVAGMRFDLITANPPYLPGLPPPARGRARAWEGGPDGRAVLDRVLAGARAALRPGGRLLIVHSELCDIEATAAAMARSGLDTEIVAEHRGAPGPLVAARAPRLRSERIAVLRGTAPRD